MSDELREAHARNLLNDKLFLESFDSLAESIHNTWINSSVHDVDSREQAWLSLRLLERIKLHLTSIVETGEMSRKISEFKI
jgi:hypothetical protein